MNILERRTEDIEAVRALLETGELPSSGLERTRGWVAMEGGQIISHIAMEETDDAVVLRSLATAPSAQGRGIARQLMDLAEAQAGERTLLLRTITVGPGCFDAGILSQVRNGSPGQFERHPNSRAPSVLAIPSI